MPSATALRIGLKIEDYLGRKLSGKERIMCEEIALNFYPRPIIAYIDGLSRKRSVPKTFGLVYHPIMNGVLRGCYRRHDIIWMKGRMQNVYRRVGEFVGDGFSERELDAIVFLADDCTDGEIDAAITYARYRGIHHAAYLKAVILGNRQRYTLTAIRFGRLKQYLPDVALLRDLDTGLKRVPKVDRLRDLWRAQVNKAMSKVALITAELNARKSLLKRSKHERPDTADQGEATIT